MSSKTSNEPVLMTPFSLLRVSEYGRYFDGSPVGFLYRLLRTRVWRKGTEDLKYFKEGGWVTELSSRYGKGDLSAYFSLGEIEEATGFTIRYIRSLIDKLVRLKLIKVENFGDGLVFVLGRRLLSEDEHGYGVGYGHEGFYIDAWETWLEKDEVEFRTFLVNELAPPKAREKLLGKILPKVGKNFSENSVPKTEDSLSPGEEKAEVQGGARIDKVKIVKAEDKSSDLASLYARIRSEADLLEAEKLARLALKEGAPLGVVNHHLAPHVADKYKRFVFTPRFAIRLQYFDDNPPSSPPSALASLWKALAEDVTGNNYGDKSNFYVNVVGAYKKHLLSKYSYDQCLWTIKKVATDERNLNFLVQGGRNLISLVHQNSKEYHTLMSRPEKPKAQQHKPAPEQPQNHNSTNDEQDIVKSKYPLLDLLFDEVESRMAAR